MSDEEQNEAIGYRRSPRKYRFKPGRSGNPKSRPKKARAAPRDDNMAAILDRAGNETILINGEEVTMRELEIRSIQRKAAKGEVQASRCLSKLREDAGIGATPRTSGGVLLVPAPMDLDRFSEAVFEQQAKFRDTSYCEAPGRNDLSAEQD